MIDQVVQHGGLFHGIVRFLSSKSLSVHIVQLFVGDSERQSTRKIRIR